jgi:glycosyltransferase involved in cell wall biosynthesis
VRIGFFCPHSDPLARVGEPDAGGQCVYEARVAASLAAMDHEVRCYTRHYGRKKRHEGISPGAEVFRYPMGPEGFLRKEDMGQYLAEFSHHLHADQEPWLKGAEILHGHYWDGGVAALTASLAFGKPLLFTSHSLGALKQDRLPDRHTYRYDIRIPAERRVMQAADGIIALSSVEQSALMERYGIEERKIHVVPGGVDVNRFAPRGTKQENKNLLGIRTDHMVFTVGRLDARKGFVELVEAMPRVIREVERRGQSVCFMMPAGPRHPSGSEADVKRSLQERARKLGVRKHIRWFSRLAEEELLRCYAAADVFVCPSLYEPFGLVLVEAMASGTPVVATQRGGPVDIVTPGVDGYLADPQNSEELAARILDVLLAGPERSGAMGQAALKKAHERYSWPAVASRIAAVYAKVIETAIRE